MQFVTHTQPQYNAGMQIIWHSKFITANVTWARPRRRQRLRQRRQSTNDCVYKRAGFYRRHANMQSHAMRCDGADDDGDTVWWVFVCLFVCPTKNRYMNIIWLSLTLRILMAYTPLNCGRISNWMLLLRNRGKVVFGIHEFMYTPTDSGADLSARLTKSTCYRTHFVDMRTWKCMGLYE